MKILVLSDSHSLLGLMRQCIAATAPDAVIHLGDHYRDGQTLREEFPDISFYLVPGNCDSYDYSPDPEIRLIELGGVRLYLTQGHKHGVKQGLYRLEQDARASRVDAVLYGHTHLADCRYEDGLWILNPGAATWGGGAGLITIRGGKIVNCTLLPAADIKNL